MPDPHVELRLTARDQTAAAFQSVRRGLGSLDTTVASLRSAVLRLGPAFAAVGAGLAVAGLSRLVKAGVNAADQLGVISKRTGIAVETLSELKFAAEQTETDFETLTTGLQRFELNLAKAGISGKDTIGMLTALADRVKQTEDPAKRLEIAFKTFGRAAGPELVPFLALGGGGINELIQRLRDMGFVITGEMQKASDDFNDQLSTIGTGLTAAATILATGLLKGLGNLSELRLDRELRQDIEDIGTALGEAARNAKDAIVAITTFADSAARSIANASRFLNTTVTELGKYEKVEGAFEAIGIATKGVAGDTAQLTGRVADLQEKVKGYRAEVEKAAVGGIVDETGLKAIANAEVAIGRLEERLKELGAGSVTSGGEPGPAKVDEFLNKLTPPKKASGALNDAKALIEASLAATQDALEREQRNLDQALEDELVSFRDFYARRTAIAVAGIDAEITAKREALAASTDQGDVARITSEITVLERKRGDVAIQARRDQIAAERELVDQLNEVRARVLEAEGDTVEAARIRVEAEFRELRARLLVEGNQLGLEWVDRVINIEGAKARLQQLQTEFDRLRDQLSQQETRVNVEVETGLTGELAGRREIVRLHTETAAKLAPIVDQMRVIAQTIGPEEISRVAGLASEIEVLGTVTNEIAQSLNNEFKNAAASAFGDFLRGSKTAQQAFADFGTAILDSVAQLAAQNIAEELFGDLFKAGKKGAGGGGFLDLLGSLFHQGGIVGSRGPGRRVPALAFAGAPRLHDGGALGLRRDEVPAILQRGEEVLTRDDPRHRANAGSVTVNMNVTTPDAQSFRRSSGQIAVEFSTALGRARRNLP